MKKIQALLIVASLLFLFSCASSVTPGQAASHHYSRCRDMR